MTWPRRLPHTRLRKNGQSEDFWSLNRGAISRALGEHSESIRDSQIRGVATIKLRRHSGAMCQHRTRNLEIPGLRLAAHPGMTVEEW
jgi:hypothetical protein